MGVHPQAGQLPALADLINVPRLITAYFTNRPDPAVPSQRVAFGTSGHRGSALDHSFNEAHILAVTEAICRYRQKEGISGPLFLGIDTHALSEPAQATALEVLAAHGVEVMVDARDGYTPTPVISHAILTYNRERQRGLADGIVITPSHNPPHSGGIKYNPPHGGPAETGVTKWIETEANTLLAANLAGVARLPYEKAKKAPTTHRHHYVEAYVDDLPAVVDIPAIAASGVHLGVDPLGGASVAFYQAMIERHRLNLEIVNPAIDPTFRFLTLDWDGQIRMDPSSVYAMAGLIGLKDRFRVACGNDTDTDRFGIVTAKQGLLQPNHYLAVAIAYLFANRPQWPATAGIGKTLVSSSIIDRVAAGLNRRLVEVPVGFKWFVDGLFDGSLGFGGEESAGASFLRRDGTVWSTDKDGIILNLLAAEIIAKTGKDPGEQYQELTARYGTPYYVRIDAPASPAEKARLAKLSPDAVKAGTLAGEPILAKLTKAPGNNAAIGGLKVVTANGWFAARPSGTEEIYKLYAESFRDEQHLAAIVAEAQEIVKASLAA
ncbi:MAG: phosphoglucomutase (alpha-D-glucose-1,6-bisphosphate-dependent) [Desulfobacca sp.]|uniref:phosphoglucomutase (alpha-D-glucose-1,6-bisphosphate-dependent) n=1 Tax=Desulfobacca sp. TaxID=2067990 RepID=UPI004049E028